MALSSFIRLDLLFDLQCSWLVVAEIFIWTEIYRVLPSFYFFFGHFIGVSLFHYFSISLFLFLGFFVGPLTKKEDAFWRHVLVIDFWGFEFWVWFLFLKKKIFFFTHFFFLVCVQPTRHLRRPAALFFFVFSLDGENISYKKERKNKEKKEEQKKRKREQKQKKSAFQRDSFRVNLGKAGCGFFF